MDADRPNHPETAATARSTSVQEVGLKITSPQREYYSYTGASAEAQRQGLRGWPRPDFARFGGSKQRE